MFSMCWSPGGSLRGAEAGRAGAGRQGHKHEQHTLGNAAA